jgi:uncharacterized membrane protein YhaH (DUF805 family)
MNSQSGNIKWYLKPVAVIVAILALGPLALPLVWLSPAFKRWHKVVMTILIILVTAWLVKGSMDLYKVFSQEMKDLQDVMKR